MLACSAQRDLALTGIDSLFTVRREEQWSCEACGHMRTLNDPNFTLQLALQDPDTEQPAMFHIESCLAVRTTMLLFQAAGKYSCLRAACPRARHGMLGSPAALTPSQLYAAELRTRSDRFPQFTLPDRRLVQVATTSGIVESACQCCGCAFLTTSTRVATSDVLFVQFKRMQRDAAAASTGPTPATRKRGRGRKKGARRGEGLSKIHTPVLFPLQVSDNIPAASCRRRCFDLAVQSLLGHALRVCALQHGINMYEARARCCCLHCLVRSEHCVCCTHRLIHPFVQHTGRHSNVGSSAHARPCRV